MRRVAVRDGALQFAKFCLVGGSGVLVNMVVFNATLLILHGNRQTAGVDLANRLGFIAAVISNYYLNRRWTFRSDGAVASEFAKSLSVSVAAYALNLGVFVLFHRRLLCPNPSQVLAIAFVMPFDYVANRAVELSLCRHVVRDKYSPGRTQLGRATSADGASG